MPSYIPPGYTEDDLNYSVAQYIASRPGFTARDVMQEGHIEYQNGQPGVMVKYNAPDGTTTEFTPLRRGSGANVNWTEGGGGGGGGGMPMTTVQTPDGRVITTTIPGAAIYGQAAAFAKRAYQMALGKINQQRSRAGREWGYKFEVDPESGVVKNLGVDPDNPYGLFQKANRSQADRYQSARDAIIERGIRGGLARQATTNLRYDFGEEDAKIAQGLTDRLADLQEQQTTSKFDYDKALWEAELEALRQALLASLFNRASGGGGGGSRPAPAPAQSDPAPQYPNVGSTQQFPWDDPASQPVRVPGAGWHVF